VVYRKKTGGFGRATISNSETNNIVQYEDFILTETTTAISTTVPIRAGNGTATAPSYSFTSTTNAGVYNPFRSGNIQITNGVNVATVRNTATANTTITLPSSTGLTSQVYASEYFIGETTTAQSINNSTTKELTLNGLTTSGNVGGFSLFSDGNIKVPSTGIYLFRANPAFASNATGYRTASLQLNATTLLSKISCP